jgi:Fe-S-cluster-containing dehydrogenase component
MNSEKPRNRKILMIESSRCIGCHACEVACKLEHELPAGPRPVKVIQVGPSESGQGMQMRYESVTCFHCERPACVAACPTGAMQKREDGIVFSHPDLCIGCQTCAVACPFGIPELNPSTGKIAKCDGCRSRIDMGLWPACALKCPSGCLSFGCMERVIHDLRVREALTIVRTLAVR